MNKFFVFIGELMSLKYFGFLLPSHFLTLSFERALIVKFLLQT